MTSGIGHKPKMPNSFTILFATSQLCFGYDCGFINYLKPKYRLLFKLLSITFTAAMVILATIPFWKYSAGTLLYFLYFVQLIAYLLVFFTSKYTVYKFLFDLFLINIPTPSKQLNVYGIVAIVYLVTVSFIHVLANQLNCNYFLSTCYWFHVPTVITYIPSYSIEIISIIQALILQCVYVYIENIKAIVNIRKDNIKDIQTLYAEIADCYDNISPMFCKLTLITMVTNIPKLMVLLWYTLHFIINDFKVPKIILFTSLSLLLVVNMSITSFVTEMIKYQVKCLRKLLVADTIKISVKNKMEISNCLLYIEERSIAEKAWNVIPLDIDLNFSALSICVSYLIVIIQLTHAF